MFRGSCAVVESLALVSGVVVASIEAALSSLFNMAYTNSMR